MLNQIPSEFTTIAGYPDGNAFEALVGDAINLTPQVTGAGQSLTLTQKPSGSAAAVASGSFTVDLPGVYLATIANGGFTRPITFYAFPVAVLSRPVQNGTTVNRSHLRAYVAGPGALAAGGTNALRTLLESASPVPTGINWTAFGN